MKVYVFNVTNVENEEVEFLHKFCHALNIRKNVDARILLQGNDASVKMKYFKYGNRIFAGALDSAADMENAIFVVPEIKAFLFASGQMLAGCKRKCIFWKSVDNYYGANPEAYHMAFAGDENMLHLVQTEETHDFLKSAGVDEKMIVDVSEDADLRFIEKAVEVFGLSEENGLDHGETVPIKAAIAGNPETIMRSENIINRCVNPYIDKEDRGPIELVATVAAGNPGEDYIPGIENCSFDRLAEKFAGGEVDVIIIPLEFYIGQSMLISELLKRNISINSIFCIPRDVKEGDTPDKILFSYVDSPYLPYLEFHVCDQCNLNCKACEHYAPLVKGEVQTSYEDFKKDLSTLKKYIDDIGVIRIMGGEPLLNKDLYKYIILSKELYPKSFILVVTNALLLLSIDEELLWLMKQLDVYFSISFYPPLKEKMPEIEARLKKYGVKYWLSPVMDYFRMRYTLDGCNDPKESFYNCLQAHCHNLYRGHIGACFLPFTTKYFNETFKDVLGKEIPEDGAIDLYAPGMSTQYIKIALLNPFERCRYCTPGQGTDVPWEQASKTPKLSDWVIDAE